MSPIMCAFGMATNRSAPKKRPTAICCSRARRAGSPNSPACMRVSRSLGRMASRHRARGGQCQGAKVGDNVAVTALLAALAVVLSGFVKGTIGIGFPTLGTPLLSLVVDVKTAVVLLILPNIVMDAIQLRRRGDVLPTARRFLTLLAFGAAGMFIGTRLLVELSPGTVTFILGCFLLVFVGLNVTRVAPRLPARLEPWLSPPVGLLAGIVGGITNVPGTPLVLYFYALGMPKPDFVRSVALTFMTYKLIQLGAVSYYGLLTWPLLGWSLALTVAGLAGFWVGVRLQEGLDQRAFNRAVLGFLAALGLWLTLR
jgi:hypothetical protein